MSDYTFIAKPKNNEYIPWNKFINMFNSTIKTLKGINQVAVDLCDDNPDKIKSITFRFANEPEKQFYKIQNLDINPL